MKSAIFFLGFALVLSGCSRTLKDFSAPVETQKENSVLKGGIIGGDPVTDSDPIAAMTAMVIDVNQGSICTGSILNAEWLLTAAHCVAEAELKSLVVVFKGTFQDIVDGKTSSADLRKVKEAKVNPKYDETRKLILDLATKAQQEGRELTSKDIDAIKDWGDVALVRINGVMPTYKKAAQLMYASTHLYPNQSVVLAGYGQTGSDSSSSFGSLRKVTVQVSEPVWGSSEVLLDQTHDKGACHGDSGGPAYVSEFGQLYLFGVTSRGVGDSADQQCIHFSAYTNATYYRSWIKSVTGL